MRRQITAAMISQYAEVSQDTAAFHLDTHAAREAGYERPIAHGMYIMGLAQSLYLVEHRNHWISSYSMKFQKPLYSETTACFQFEACEYNIQVTVTSEDGDVIAKGTFTVKERAF
ncbi:MaoC family dehydratase [Paenibacillus sp. D2_2]|uniref:MaoC family dehydratase n=1 Tax=Paenibacillus sp. D2_2 TaxID=3073092 RepID=UPI0028162B1E|nr:MaoC family dehydratase [Paenibacillus sp. D2_2]WMT43118.1 MaoC family dehydratase [Paenibacillus sp. D2_2]